VSGKHQKEHMACHKLPHQTNTEMKRSARKKKPV